MAQKFLFILLALPMFLSGQEDFATYFQKKSLRFDFLLGGNSDKVTVYPQQIKQEPYWAGSLVNLIDTFGYGTYRFCVSDAESEKLLFSKGFSTLFQEWQTTSEAKEMNRAFYHAAIFPFPKNKVNFKIEARQWDGNFKTIFEEEIDPADYFILDENPQPFEAVAIENNGAPSEKVDLVILAEGYTLNEMEKFKSDARRVTGYLFEEEPFKSNRDKFNVTALLTPSVDSGTDVPGESIYVNTIFNSTFYTFDIDRYLTTSDMKSIYDAAAAVPYDHIYVLVNTERYGGGGFYNFLSVCTSDNLLSKEVFVHEFGHGFAGLGDEYYTSSVAYEEFYNLEVEPWEPNLTTLVDFDKKWKSMVASSVPIPTPRKPKFSATVGVFEGGGYTAKGIYSPVMDCRMKSNRAEGFCPVCIDAIQRVIDFHCK
ncbi:Peptidase M64 N-terminus [Mariniphaga anaerophila]|uniref:Peptidase M64 N-terminus n=1 Tax=Mariniphaga anaerophila TaxID=1484053 RepID=A0A1M5A488_9BACT|nr:M64 family metallopeptidase [Mariniphaga anaerophila]SHF25113.1 Peptidase M64 N-terminus [Mariniphaga anaerophila]